jgi:predicted nucleotidyltransferase
MKSNNLDRKELAIKLINEFNSRIKNSENVVGVCLLGGLAKRNLFDEYSDIDIAVFLDARPKINFLPDFSFKISIQKNHFEFNLSQLVISEEINDWSIPKIEAYSKGEILYDQNNRIYNLIKSKQFNLKKFEERIIDCLNQFNWKVNFHCLNTYKRGFPEASHLLLNEGIELLIDAVYCINKNYLPHIKWWFKDLENLDIKPKRFVYHIKNAILITSTSKKEIERRIYHLNQIYQWLNIYVYDNYNIQEDNYYKYWATNISNRQINKKSFSNDFMDKYKTSFNEIEQATIKGFMSYHLISSEMEFLSILNVNQNLSMVKLSEELKEKIKELLDF